MANHLWAKKDPNELWQTQLGQGLVSLGIDLSDNQQQTLLAYLRLLRRWNQVFNLTAVRDPAVMVSRQLLDSLAILPWVHGPRVLDVGSGAGLPGIPLAIARPDIQFMLLDSNGKKTRFLRQAVAELGLSNIEVSQQRVEQLLVETAFDQITSRAFAALSDFLSLTTHLLKPDGQWLAMKGTTEQPGNQSSSDVVCDWHALHIPAESAQRHLAVCRRSAF